MLRYLIGVCVLLTASYTFACGGSVQSFSCGSSVAVASYPMYQQQVAVAAVQPVFTTFAVATPVVAFATPNVIVDNGRRSVARTRTVVRTR